MIVYDNLWKTMKEKNITQYKLIVYHKFSTAQISRLRHNKSISTTTLNGLCKILDCPVEGVISYVPDPPAEETKFKEDEYAAECGSYKNEK